MLYKKAEHIQLIILCLKEHHTSFLNSYMEPDVGATCYESMLIISIIFSKLIFKENGKKNAHKVWNLRIKHKSASFFHNNSTSSHIPDEHRTVSTRFDTTLSKWYS